MKVLLSALFVLHCTNLVARENFASISKKINRFQAEQKLLDHGYTKADIVGLANVDVSRIKKVQKCQSTNIIDYLARLENGLVLQARAYTKGEFAGRYDCVIAIPTQSGEVILPVSPEYFALLKARYQNQT